MNSVLQSLAAAMDEANLVQGEGFEPPKANAR